MSRHYPDLEYLLMPWATRHTATRAEVEYYLSAFKEEDAQYPEMFSQIAESWLAARGL